MSDRAVGACHQMIASKASSCRKRVPRLLMAWKGKTMTAFRPVGPGLPMKTSNVLLSSHANFDWGDCWLCVCN